MRFHDDSSLRGTDRTTPHRWNYLQPQRLLSIKWKCRHNTDWWGCSSFDSGARFHGRFTVPFAWLIEACLSRKHKSAFSRDIWASQAGQREAGEHCTLLICSFWFRCFYNSLKAPVLWESLKFESSCFNSSAWVHLVWIWSNVFLGIVKSDSPVMEQWISPCASDGVGYISPTLPTLSR